MWHNVSEVRCGTSPHHTGRTLCENVNTQDMFVTYPVPMST